MYYILIEPTEIRDTINQFRNSVIKAAVEKKRVQRNFVGGAYTIGIEYTLICSKGKLMIMLPDEDRWKDRVPHLFSLNPKGTDYTSDVEINIPLGLDRKVGGCYVKGSDGILICNRGKFTSYKSSIPNNVSLKYFEDSIIHVTDDSKYAEVIMIANLKELDFIDRLGIFTDRIKKLKFKIKLENQNKRSFY